MIDVETRREVAPPASPTDSDAARGGGLLGILGGVFPLALLYLLATLFVIGFIADSNLTSLVISWKIVSLAHLIYEHRETPRAIELPRPFKTFNDLILVCSFIIIALMFLKLFVDETGVGRMPPFGQTVMTMFKEHSHYVSIAPILAYFVFDLVLYDRTRDDPEKRRKVMQFLIYKDLFCTLPLLVVFLFTEIYAAVTDITGDQIEIFFSGSIAVIVFSSAIATETLNELHRRQARRAERPERSG